MLMPAIQIIKLKICFNRQRKSNSKRKREPCQEFLIESMLKRVETTLVKYQHYCKKIHAVTNYGFILKVIMFLFSNTLNKIEK